MDRDAEYWEDLLTYATVSLTDATLHLCTIYYDGCFEDYGSWVGAIDKVGGNDIPQTSTELGGLRNIVCVHVWKVCS